MSACSGKVRYASKPAARRARQAKSSAELPFYAYKCHACGGYHLSSMKPSTWRRTRFSRQQEV